MGAGIYKAVVPDDYTRHLIDYSHSESLAMGGNTLNVDLTTLDIQQHPLWDIVGEISCTFKARNVAQEVNVSISTTSFSAKCQFDINNNLIERYPLIKFVIQPNIYVVNRGDECVMSFVVKIKIDNKIYEASVRSNSIRKYNTLRTGSIKYTFLFDTRTKEFVSLSKLLSSSIL